MKFVFDLDGTICFKGQPIREKILNTLDYLTKAGHEVIFASARPIRDMLPVINKRFHHYTMIGGNGSLISKERKVVYSNAFSTESVNGIMQLIEDFDATYLIDGKWDYAYTGSNNHPILQNLDTEKLANLVHVDALSSIVKILILTSTDNEQLISKLSELDVFVNIHSNENIIDISPKGINKWSALMELGIEQGTYVAFGNDTNDISMFENAMHTVMVGYHTQLAPYAAETIHLEGDYEQMIVEKLNELSKTYTLMNAQ
ncbi:HAD-IIB family hydrolase [Bacillus sp. JJ722]|uniref:HAD-IIB family hydrolase n=1 Tax=Bacillus sp. JJ722 TaxID=3122973 RepID=UPI002FFF2EA6